MKQAFACLGLAALLAGAAVSQSTGKPPAFDIADVRVNDTPATPATRMAGPFIAGGRYTLQAATMLDLIVTAYGVDADTIVGGPAWLEADRFDITAKVPVGSIPVTMKLMLRTLLLDRFKLEIHNDSRPMPAYALKAGKRPLLKQADGSGETGCKGQGVQGSNGLVAYTCRNMTMETFAAGLRDMAGSQYFEGHPVVDQTEMKGPWSFDITFRRPNATVPNGEERISIFDAVVKLGLELAPTAAPAPVLVVDSVNEKPSPNSPGIAESLPSLPTEFEVADVKPSDPASKVMRFLVQPGGRLNVQGQTLKNLIQRAWNIYPMNMDETLVGPKFLDTERFDIIAKTPEHGAEETYRGPAPDLLDLEGIFPMLRTLMINRFKMTFHYEDRPIRAYTLTAAKPKLQKADPAGRTGCRAIVGLVEKDPRAANPLLRLMTCTNMTMTQFTENLPLVSAATIRGASVLDATGLAGAWDFTFSFSGVPLLGANGGGGGTPDAPNSPPIAADPTATITLFDALEKQLGLKLEVTKRPGTVLVIDHMEQKPTDN